MSSKGTIFLTNDNEHCYEETFEKDGDEFRIYLEIKKENIKEFGYNEDDGLIIGIRGDSDIAKIIRLARNGEERIKK